MHTKVYLALGTVIGATFAWQSTAQAVRARDPIAICHKALNASLDELNTLNVQAGMKPHSPFSIDDYCGYQCGADNRCLDECRTCLNDEEGRTEQ